MLAQGGYVSPHGAQGGPEWGPHGSWEGSTQPQASGKKKLSVDEQVEQYYHEELIEKLTQVKGVGSCSQLHVVSHLTMLLVQSPFCQPTYAD